ncbi:PD40 domain-containing protein [Saccharothrix texasensis]|uniref:WD40 repeat protein n=1 Tax=Saccharothrix texasensis TaxID=103734 RepID=A0A3N1HHI6_9PSEU|nr:PD40 domain-containing protein [Saccharothrix texasensis]ROP41983.1 WD40 repeat protein [Saccharothrix texasensis]
MELEGDGAQVSQAAWASGGGSVNQVGRDQHVHLGDGAGERVRTFGPVVGECPYPGLAAFEAEQADWFFGRDAVVADLVGLVDRRSREGGIQVVIAPSGAGKSSLLRAGLAPRLARAALPGSDRWRVVVTTPTAEPSVEPGDGEGRVVLVVDQFEELFTLCADEDRRKAYVDRLAELAADPARALVVLGVRADFHAACADYPPLRAALQDAPLVVGPMNRAELRETIVMPARLAGLDIEAGLVDLLLTDLGATSGYEAGRLPLLAHALRACWQQRNGSTLTVQGYRDSGGIQHALATTADATFASLDEDGQRLARTVFLRLVRVGDGTDDTRRRVPLRDLPAAVVDAFTRARLLTNDRDTVEITHEALLRDWPLLRRWIDDDRAGRLVHQAIEESAAEWERGGRHDASLLYRGSRLELARSWASSDDLSGTGRAFLLASEGARRRATSRRRVARAALVGLSVAASTAAAVAYQQQGKAVEQRDVAVYHRVLAEADQLRGTDASLSAQLSLLAHRMRPDEETYTRLLTAGQVPLHTRLTGHTENINQLAITADGRTVASIGADSTVRLWNLADPHHPVPLAEPLPLPDIGWAVAFSPDGRVLATTDSESARLWDVSDPTRPAALAPLDGHDDAVFTTAFSPDGRVLATGGLDRTVRLWDVADPTRPSLIGEPLTQDGGVAAMAFSPDGRTLVTAQGPVQNSRDQTVRLWNVADPAHVAPSSTPLVTGHVNPVLSLAFTPDGRTLATGSADSTTRLWNVADPARPAYVNQLLSGTARMIMGLRFSPDGRVLATAAGDATTQLWSVAEPARPAALGPPLSGHSGPVSSVVFGPSGSTLVTAGYDHSVEVWDLPGTWLTGHTSSVNAIAYRPDGDVFATGSADTTVRLWRAGDPPRELGPRLTGHTANVTAVAFSPDGRTLAAVGNDQTLRLWNVTDPASPTVLGRPWKVHDAAVTDVAFSPDGRVLATSGGDATVRLWSITDPARPTRLAEPLTGFSLQVQAVAFSPDGRTLAAGGVDRTVLLWNVADPAHPTPVHTLTGHTGTVYSVEFSPDGRTLASGGADSAVRLWDVAAPERATAIGGPITGHTTLVTALAFSPDGRRLATAGGDATVRLWDVADPARVSAVGRPLGGQSNAAYGVAFSPDGHTLASGSYDYAVRVWSLDVDRNIDRICGATSGALTEEAWRRYVGADLAYAPPC